ncbi:MAG: DUF427 domain-containing protein [Burkholderiales bacterium]
MQATVNDKVVAATEDVVECGGYQYFPISTVRMDWLQKGPKTKSDLECPHGVQFYDVVIDGQRHERAAWIYEAPLASMQQVAARFGFWKDVKVG